MQFRLSLDNVQSYVLIAFDGFFRVGEFTVVSDIGWSLDGFVIKSRCLTNIQFQVLWNKFL